MKRTKKDISREIGLEVGSICGQYFLKLEHLHYGYWTSDIEVDVANLSLAQDKYTKFVVSHIPEGVETVLDVGCGTGQIAKELLDIGYEVDCVSPSPYLKQRASELLGGKSRVFECFYEDLETANRYDLVLFCESLQYIDLEKALSNTSKFLNNGGYLLICDVFSKDIVGKEVMSGGHKLAKFYGLIEKSPFRLIENVDITEETAPNMDLFNDVLEKVVGPVVNAGIRLFKSRHPLALKFLRWRYRKKIDKLRGKYFGGGKTGEEFKKYKSYQLFLYKKGTQE
ncbi:MAG: class I SAM-dependent methyltransferase [Planctomycetota bacterium]|jgi:SAM-dependent methyltransferase